MTKAHYHMIIADTIKELEVEDKVKAQLAYKLARKLQQLNRYTPFNRKEFLKDCGYFDIVNKLMAEKQGRNAGGVL